MEQNLWKSEYQFIQLFLFFFFFFYYFLAKIFNASLGNIILTPKVVDYFKEKLKNCAFGNGVLEKFTEAFYSWLLKVHVRKRGTIIKSFYFSQVPIDITQVRPLVQMYGFMTINEWKKIATDLKYEIVPHSWYIIKEKFLRYCQQINK
jgi:hypothetical protein